MDAAEKHLLSLAAANDAKQSVNIQMGVINLREDLFAWYKSQGFEIVDKLPNDPELLRIIRDDLLDQVHWYSDVLSAFAIFGFLLLRSLTALTGLVCAHEKTVTIDRLGCV